MGMATLIVEPNGSKGRERSVVGLTGRLGHPFLIAE